MRIILKYRVYYTDDMDSLTFMNPTQCRMAAYRSAGLIIKALCSCYSCDKLASVYLWLLLQCLVQSVSWPLCRGLLLSGGFITAAKCSLFTLPLTPFLPSKGSFADTDHVATDILHCHEEILTTCRSMVFSYTVQVISPQLIPI